MRILKRKKLKIKRMLKELEERSTALDKETDRLIKYLEDVDHLIPKGVLQKMRTHLDTIKFNNRELK